MRRSLLHSTSLYHFLANTIEALVSVDNRGPFFRHPHLVTPQLSEVGLYNMR